MGVSAEGPAIVADGLLPGGKFIAFRRDAMTGMERLRSLFGNSHAWAVSADGNTIVGREVGKNNPSVQL